MDSLDKLLAQIKAEYDGEKTPKPQPQPDVNQPSILPANPSATNLDNLLAEFEADIEPASKLTNKSASFVDHLLAEVQADITAQDQAEELRKQQEIAQERIRQAKVKAQQREALKKQAKDWLEKLDPFSPEGLWFERFAEGYPSKLDAAIEYLQTQ